MCRLFWSFLQLFVLEYLYTHLLLDQEPGEGVILLCSHRAAQSHFLLWGDSQGLFITLNTSPEFTQWETIKEHYCRCLCGFPNRNINHGVSSWAEMHSRWRHGWRACASCAFWCNLTVWSLSWHKNENLPTIQRKLWYPQNTCGTPPTGNGLTVLPRGPSTTRTD